MDVFQIFTPTDTPTVTYVDRSDRHLEAQLRAALKTPKMITSVSGLSKSGKTVLIKKVLGSGLVDHSQKMTVAASATAEKKTVGHRS